MKKLYYILVVLGILCAGISFSQDASAATVTDSASDDNTTASANRIDIGDTILGTISETDDLDYYVFSLNSAGCVTLKMTSYMRYYCIILYNQDGEEIWYTHYNEWTETVGYRRDTYDLYLEQGTYFMEINGYEYGDRNKSDGNYECNTSFVSSQVTNVESDNSFIDANNITLDSQITGQISIDDDCDIYKFTISETGHVNLKMTSYMKYYCIVLYNQDGEEIWYTHYNEWTETVGYRRDTYDLYLEQGTYFMKINGYEYGDRNKSTGKYILNTEFISSNTIFENDDNSFAAANLIEKEEVYTGQISINDDFDTYQFDVSSGEKIFINIISYMKYYCIKLYNVDGEEIWYTDYNEWNENVGYRKDTYEIVFSPGTYFMQINGYKYGGDYKSVGKYQFSLNSVDTKKPDDNPSDPTDVDKPVETPSDPAEIERPVKTPSNTVKKPGRVSRVRIYKRKKSLYLSWNPVSKASGYQICYSTSKTFKGKKTVTVSSNNATLRKLKAKKKYYVKVRAYTYSNGKKVYGAYSKVVKQKTL